MISNFTETDDQKNKPRHIYLKNKYKLVFYIEIVKNTDKHVIFKVIITL